MRVLSLLFTLLSALAGADPLDRIAAANEALAGSMEDFYLSRVPELKDVLPDPAWDTEMRAAGACFVERYAAARGAGGLDAYVRTLEAWAETGITSVAQLSADLPALLAGPLPVRLSEECGIVAISIRRAEASGLIDALSDPAVMTRLMGD